MWLSLFPYIDVGETSVASLWEQYQCVSFILKIKAVFFRNVGNILPDDAGQIQEDKISKNISLYLS